MAMYRFCYRLTGGAIGDSSGGMPILLLTTTGRKTGRPRTILLHYVTDGENIVVVASNAGRPRHPLWWLNLEQNPEAEEASGDERKRLWRLAVETYPGYEEFQKTSDRQIPVVILRPRE